MNTKLEHVSFAFTIILFLFLMLLPSCGGGGGGGGDGGDDVGGQTLGIYDFSLSFLDGHPIQISSSTGTAITLEEMTDNGHITGSYDLDADTIILDGGPRVKATTNLWAGPLGIIRINLNTSIESVDGNHPTEGSVSISVGDPLGPEYSVTFTISTASDTVVDMVNNDTLETKQYPWNQFEELLWSAAPDWQRQASFAYYIINYYFYELRSAVKALTLIEENDTVLPSHNVTVNGDEFPGTPPLAVDKQGTLVFSCTSGNAGPGSDFSEVFHDYWVDESSDDIDKLYEGTVNFVGFLRNSDDARDVITSIGFVPNGEQDPGGVFYDDGLTIYDIKATSPGVFDKTASITITGRYTILFSEQ
jgi:hypothetical protein